MKLNRANPFVYNRQGILLLLSCTMIISLFLVSSTVPGPQVAYACQCGGRTPQEYDTTSDVIFVGRLVEMRDNVPFEWSPHITFDVSKSWKGIDTRLVTVHIDDIACETSFRPGNEYLVHAYRDSFELRMPTCSGTTWTENQEGIAYEIAYLDALYEPVRIIDGHTGGVNALTLIQVLGVSCGIGAVAFVMLVRRRRSRKNK